MLKRILRRGLGFIYSVEYFLDLIMYIKYVMIRRDRLSKFYKPYKINFTEDVVIAFYCGVGDFIYGIPLYCEIKKQLNSSGSDAKLIAYVGGAKNRMNSPLIASLIKELGLFDEVKVFTPPVPAYWKTLKLEELYSKETTDNIFSFAYKTNNKVPNRISSIFSQYSLKNSSNDPYGIPLVKRDSCAAISDLIDAVLSTNKKVVLLHLDARSGNYNYDEIVNLSLALIKIGYTVLSYTPKIECVDDNYLEFERLLASPYFFTAPAQLSIFNTLYLLDELSPFVVAVNSVFWPLTQITKTKTLALHYIDSGDGYQFFHPEMIFVTTNKYSYKKLKKNKISEKSVIYAYPEYYDVDSRNYRNYHSDYIVHLVALYS